MAEGDNGDQKDGALNIFQRINACMAEVGHLEKDKTIKLKGGAEIDYISHDAVSAAVRKPFVKYGIAVQPSVIGIRTDGNRTELQVEVTFVNVDDPEDRFSVETLGYGVDASDKGPGKALSYAVKYAYLKVLMLNSADDIEAEDIQHDPATKRESAIGEAQDKTRAALETWATNLRDAIKGAKTIKDVDEIQRINKDALMQAPEVTRGHFIALITGRKQEIAELSDDAVQGPQ